MKKLTYLLFIAIGAIGCSVESEDSTEDLLTADAKFKVQETSYTQMLFEELVCAGEETTITLKFPQRTNPQGKNLSTNIRVHLLLENNEWLEIYQENLNGVTSIEIPYTFEQEKTYTLRYSAENGPWNPSQFLEVQDCSDCEESFSYEANEDGSYTFTYVPAEDMVGANLVFTFAQGVVVEGLENWNPHGVTKQTTINLEACETYSWTIGLDTVCSGQGQQNANLWTDFNVGEDSKKGVLNNIVKSCN